MIGSPAWCAAPRDLAWHDTGRRPEAAHGHGKVPEIALMFWVVKIAATTLGETGGDAVSMSLHLGYAVSTAIFFSLFAGTVFAQIRSASFHPLLYWAVILATTTAGTTMADFADRSLGVGYLGGVLILAALLSSVMVAWRVSLGAISSSGIRNRKAETFYWMTILLSNTLGTALGDFAADRAGLGYGGGALIFALILVLLGALYLLTSVSRVMLFWLAFVMTRPLGATVGDFLTKPHASGGLELSRYTSSAMIGLFIISCILLMPPRQGGAAREEP